MRDKLSSVAWLVHLCYYASNSRQFIGNFAYLEEICLILLNLVVDSFNIRLVTCSGDLTSIKSRKKVNKWNDWNFKFLLF